MTDKEQRLKEHLAKRPGVWVEGDQASPELERLALAAAEVADKRITAQRAEAAADEYLKEPGPKPTAPEKVRERLTRILRRQDRARRLNATELAAVEAQEAAAGAEDRKRRWQEKLAGEQVRLPAMKVLVASFAAGSTRRPLKDWQVQRLSTAEHGEARIAAAKMLETAAARWAEADKQRKSIVAAMTAKTVELGKIDLLHSADPGADAAKQVALQAEIAALTNALNDASRRLSGLKQEENIQRALVDDALLREARDRMEFAASVVEWAGAEVVAQSAIVKWKADEIAKGKVRRGAPSKASLPEKPTPVWTVTDEHTITQL